MGLGVVLLEDEGPAVGGLRLLVPTLPAQGVAQVDVGLGEVLLESDPR
jgi:hypothetical protein